MIVATDKIKRSIPHLNRIIRKKRTELNGINNVIIPIDCRDHTEDP